MDPHANLKEQRRIVQQIHYDEDNGLQTPLERLHRLVELVEALDKWLPRGGALPDEWRSNGRK